MVSGHASRKRARSLHASVHKQRIDFSFHWLTCSDLSPNSHTNSWRLRHDPELDVCHRLQGIQYVFSMYSVVFLRSSHFGAEVSAGESLVETFAAAGDGRDGVTRQESGCRSGENLGKVNGYGRCYGMLWDAMGLWVGF